MLSLFGGKNSVELPDSYSFTNQMDVMLTSTNKRGKQEQMPITFHFKPESSQMGISMKYNEGKDSGEAFTIFDLDNKAMVVLTNSGQQKMAMSIPIDDKTLESYQNENEAADNSKMSFTKTGRTKTILGYSCQEYKFESEESSGTTWVTDELPAYRQNFMNMAAQAQRKNKQALPANYPTGTMLEMNMVSDKGEKSHWLVTAVKDNAPLNVKMADYQVMAMPAGSYGN